MQKNKIHTKMIALLLAIIICITTAGCSTTKELPLNEITGALPSEMAEDEKNEHTNSNTGMGRYLQKEVFVYENQSVIDIQKLADGQLVLFDSILGNYVFDEKQEHYELEEMSWLKEQATSGYVMAAAISKDGSIALSYHVSPKTDEGQAQNTDNEQGTFQWNIQCFLVTPDGIKIPIDIDISETEQYIEDFCFTETGRLFASTRGNKVYEINTEDGSVKTALTLEENPMYIEYCPNDILLCAGWDAVYLYDLKNESFVEDEVLLDFIKENYTRIEDYGERRYNLYLFGGEPNIIYLAGEKGLYRHVIGGSSVEQVIDGSLTSLADPSHKIQSAVFLENQEFMVVFSDHKVIKFTYDASVPTVPNDRLVVYSLEENNTIRQAITTYQAKNPQMQVTYKIGMEEDGVTREDALKKLNTELLDGSGPDVLVLDKMPIDSYIEKGILMDISGVAEEMNGENGLISNLINPFYREEHLYMMPAEFQIPLIAGKHQGLENVTNYEEIADLIESVREQNPEGDLIGKCSENGIMKTFFMICEPSWKKENGSLNEAYIKEFLQQTKRIYDAQMNGVPQSRKEWYDTMSEYWPEEYGTEYENNRYFNSIKNGDYAQKQIQLICGTNWYIADYAGLWSTLRIKGLEDTQIKRMDGQSKNVYYPITLVGINAATQNYEKTALFLQTLMGKEVQELVHYGYPVNQMAFDSKLVPDMELVQEDGAFSWVGSVDEDGNSFDWVVYWPDDVQIQLLRDLVKQSDTPYLQDVILEETVCREGAKYLNGSQDLDAAAKAIMDSAAIYMAE